ncbi:MAG: NPP1 family protein [Proteobacteria bacterium]|nr:NPP1 family protein [Pseudomonadota bacterium]
MLRLLIGNYLFIGLVASGCVMDLSQPVDEQASIESAVTLPHNQIQPITGIAEDRHETWGPEFSYKQGCKPYTAVDQHGNTNAGLKASGSEGGKCRDSDMGQLYARTREYPDGLVAHMYSLYFPKDNGFPFPSLGHRHDWECVVIWVKDDSEVLKVAFSQHGDFKTYDPGDVHWSGNRVRVQYARSQFTHAFMPGHKGGSTPVIASWDMLPEPAKRALNDTSFGRAITPMRENRFQSQIDKSWPDRPAVARFGGSERR